MITGFNTDVDYNGRVFHVQTEDKGRSKPVIESLVYSRGEIVASRNTRYDDLSESDAFSEDAVMERMERQHQALIREILNGKFDADGPKPFGHNIITNRSLDEVVSEFLHQGHAPDPIRVEWVDDVAFVAGTSAAGRLRVSLEESGAPAGGARVRVCLSGADEVPLPLFHGATDRQGFVDAAFDLPGGVAQAGTLELVCEARMGGAKAELRRPVEVAAEPV